MKNTLVIAVLFAIILIVGIVMLGNKQESDARDKGEKDGCVWFETEINGLTYTEAIAKCEMEND